MKVKGILTPVILLSVILGLAGIAYWDDKQTASDKTAEELKGRLFDFDPAGITSIEVTNLTAEPKTWTLTKDAEAKAWTVAAPLNYKADGEGIDRLLKIISEAKSERVFERGSRTLDGFGLEPAQILYVLKGVDGKSWTFAIGGKSPTGYASYANVGEPDQVHLVNQYLFTATNKTLTDFRDRSLGIPPVAEIRKVAVTFVGQPTIQLEKADKAWRVMQPIQAAGDSLEISKWLSGWDMLRVADFIDSPSPDLRAALTVTGKGTREVLRIRLDAGSLQKDLAIVENNEKLYTQVGDSTFVELDKASVEALRRSPKEFEDRSIFKFVSTDVTQVSLDGVEYVKEKGDWIQSSDKKPMPFIQGMIVSLEFAKADDKLSAEEAGEFVKGPALHTVRIVEGNKAPLEFSVWEKKSGSDDEEPGLVLKLGESYYSMNLELLDLLKPKSEVTEPTLGGGMKGEKS